MTRIKNLISLFTRNNFTILIIISLCLRLSLSLYASAQEENWDMVRYKQWAHASFVYGYHDVYTGAHIEIDNKTVNQPPGSIYLLSFSYFLFEFFSPIISFDNLYGEHLLHFFITLPSIMADIVIGIFIYLLAYNKKNSHPMLASTLFLLNPVIFYNSAFWGQTDALNNVFFILSLFFLFRKNYFLSVFTFLLSIYIKFSLCIFLPLYFFLFIASSKEKVKKLFSAILALLIIFLITLTVDTHPIHWLYQFFTTSIQGEDQHMSVSAFNFWWLLTAPEILFVSYHKTYGGTMGGIFSNDLFLGIPASYFGYALFIFLSAIFYIIWILKKNNKYNDVDIVLLFAVTALLGFLFLPRMHERYLYPMFPLFCIYVGRTGRFLWTYLALAFLNFINVYLIWHPAIDMQHSVLWVLTTKQFQWFCSLLLVLIGIVVYVLSLQKMFLKEHIAKE